MTEKNWAPLVEQCPETVSQDERTSSGATSATIIPFPQAPPVLNDEADSWLKGIDRTPYAELPPEVRDLIERRPIRVQAGDGARMDRLGYDEWLRLAASRPIPERAKQRFLQDGFAGPYLMATPPPIPVRPGISEATLKTAGVKYSDFPEKGSIEIPYYDLFCQPIGFSRYRLPAQRPNGQKYHQAPGTGVHVYFAPLPFSAQGPFPAKSLGIPEGEFKVLSMAEEGWPVIGLPNFNVYQRDSNGVPQLLPDLGRAFGKYQPEVIFFIGDSDTSTNFEFSRQAVFLAQNVIPAKVFLPRIPITGPKGVDDCKEALGRAFGSFFANLINTAVELDPKLSCVSLAILLLEQERDGLLKLTGSERERHFARLIRLGALARLSATGDYAICNRLYELAGGIMGLKAHKVEKAVNEELQRITQAQNRLTETQLVERFVKQVPRIKVWKKQWYRQSDIWEPVDREIYEKTALAIIPEEQRTARLAGYVLDHFQGLAHLEKNEFAGAYLFEGKDILICVTNGILRVSPNGDAKLEGFNAAKYLFTAQLAARYDESARCPIFLKTLDEALPEPEDQDLYMYWAATTLIPDCRFELALCCFGPGGTSKSTLAQGLQSALGSESVTVLKLTEICDDSGYHRPKLARSMLNVSTELDAVVLENSEDFKRLVSGEPVQAREIYGKPFQMQTPAKLLFLCNQLPRFKYGTDAELRRLRFLRFNQIPLVKDTGLKEKIAAERDGIFLLMVQYLKPLFAKGQIPEGSADSRKLHARFAQTNDPIGSFVHRDCVIDSTLSVSKDKLLNRFTAYVLDLGLPATIANTFFKVLYDRYPSLKSVRPRRYPGQRGRPKKREYLIEGIGLIRP